MMSTRADKRGHWPAGKRRHAVDEPRRAAAMESLRTLLQTRRRRGEISARALADHLGVSDRTVRRWISGEDHPRARMLWRIERWAARMSRDGG
jgi:DNA-binding transcriptional regulator YiaG